MRAISLSLVGFAVLGLAGCSSMNPFSEAPAAPAQPAAYVVFFPGHATMLDGQAKRIVAAAAADAKSDPAALVQVSGPSTRVAPGYDPRYAQPRIDAVESELLADGIGQNRIAQGSSLTDDLKVDASGAQRVELRVIKGAR